MAEITDTALQGTSKSPSTITLQEFNNRIKRLLADPSVMNCWVVAETTDVRINQHCYLQLLEKNPKTGATVAKIKAIIWGNQFRFLNARFKQVTGRDIGNDMKIMGSAKVDGTLNLKSNQPVAFSTNGYGLAPAGLLKGMRSYTFMVDANLSNRDKMPRFYDFGSNSGNSIFCRINGNFYYGAGEKYAGGSTLMVEATANAIALNTTTTIVVTFDAATHTTTIYADGKKVAQGTKITYEPWQAAPAGEYSRNYIGRTQWWDNNSDNGDVCGTIDNFRLYNIALTAEELSEIASDINNMVTTITPADTKIYSLTGVRLNSEPNKGLYIKDGKKIIK